ncbi:MAG: tetratricopeptide repeat protein, partial [Salinibacter sp.]
MRLPSSALLLLLSALALGLTGCQSENVPAPGTKNYEKAVSAFFTGVSALQVGQNYRAEQELKTAAKVAPGEPAVWVNRGLLAAQRNELSTAAARFERARSLAPNNPTIHLLSGILARERGRYEQAIDHFRRVVELDSTNAPGLYALAQVIEQRGGDTALTDALGLVTRLLAQHPNNLAVLVERARLAAKAGRKKTLRESLKQLSRRASSWPKPVRSSLQKVQNLADTP